MTKTVTERFSQSQYSSGQDSLHRADYNANGLNISDLAAIDDGATYTSLPLIEDIIRGRYVMFSSGAGAHRTLFRATATNGEWETALGNTLPEPIEFRPHLAGDQAVTDVAAVFAHPSLVSNGATVTYDGQARFTELTAYDPDNTGRGTVYVGTAAARDVANLGRVYVRTRQNGERGLVLAPHAVEAGNLFTVREAGGQDVVTIDSSGYLRARSLVGLGGGAINAGAAVVAAPTSAGGDGVDIGLLVHGQGGATAKTIMSVRRDLADTSSIVHVERDNLRIGRLPWGSTTENGAIGIHGRQITNRGLGYDADFVLWRVRRADTSDPGNTALDETAMSLSRASGLVRVPMTMTQALGTTGVNLALQRYTDFGSRFVELRRMTGETAEVISAWESDGRLATGARWKGAGVMRDARQSLIMRAKKDIGDVKVSGETSTTTWPTMQTRSVTACDLYITVRLETTLGAGLFSDREDGQQWFSICDISINGGAFSEIGSEIQGGTSNRSGTRPINVQDSTFIALNVPAGATFAVRTHVFIGGAVPAVTIRKAFIEVREALVTQYEIL